MVINHLEIDVLAHRIQKQAQTMGTPFEYNTTTLRHQYSNSECGMYCLHFIIESVGKRLDVF